LKRPNPLTGSPFVKGDVRDDGYIFTQYCTSKVRQSGTFEEMWLTPATYLRDRIRTCAAHAKKRATEQGVPFDVDTAYLQSIFPEDSLCPILGTPMTFGGGFEGRASSPSLDRRVPSLGYTRGNLCWISNKANVIKQDVTDPAVFIAVAKYMQEPLNNG
jgi:hypothetical protein